MYAPTQIYAYTLANTIGAPKRDEWKNKMPPTPNHSPKNIRIFSPAAYYIADTDNALPVEIRFYLCVANNISDVVSNSDRLNNANCRWTLSHISE